MKYMDIVKTVKPSEECLASFNSLSFSSPFFKEFKKKLPFLIPNLKNKKIILAFSAGVDSTLLFYYLFHLQKEISFKLILAHVNYQLRGQESQEDEKWVRNLAKKLSVKLFVKKINPKLFKNKNIQSVARKLRYDFFSKIYKEENIDYLFIAQHAQDSVETYLMALMQAKNSKSQLGIASESEMLEMKMVRPLLFLSKEDVLSEVKSQNLEWREDSSNYKNDYLRNEVRHQLLPLLASKHPQWVKWMAEQLSLSREFFLKQENTFKKHIQTHIIQEKNKITLFIKPYFLKLSYSQKEEYLSCFLMQYLGLLSVKKTYLSSLIQLPSLNSKAQIDLAQSWVAKVKDNKFLFIKWRQKNTNQAGFFGKTV